MSAEDYQASRPAQARSTVKSAEAAWDTLWRLGIEASPSNYELFYRYYSGDGRLSARLGAFLRAQAPALDELDLISGEYFCEDERMDAVERGADDLAQAAQGLLDQVSDERDSLATFGSTLDTWAGRFNQRSGVNDVLRAVAALAAETARVSERNRLLEQRLSASAARISKLRQDLVEVRQESTTDALTGIANRRAFEAKLRKAVKQARDEPLGTFSLLLADVDHFKRFNDQYGHKTGDHVLRLVARLLSENVKGKDTAARYGGEEFAVLLMGAGLDAGVAVAEQLRERLANQRLIKRSTGEAVGQITVSIGVAEHRPGDSGNTVVERADQALYEAKYGGRNRVCPA